jgi:hypothetical protein
MNGEPVIHPPPSDERLNQEFMNYKGKWVAIDDGKIVAYGDRAVEARDEALARGASDPLIFHVPQRWGNMPLY